jgi:hypothetical protein
MICADESDLPQALHDCAALDPADCAEHVRTMFSVPLMARRYERFYRQVLAHRARSLAAAAFPRERVGAGRIAR